VTPEFLRGARGCAATPWERQKLRARAEVMCEYQVVRAVPLRTPKCRLADVCPDPSLSTLYARAGVAEVAFEEDGAEEARVVRGRRRRRRLGETA